MKLKLHFIITLFIAIMSSCASIVHGPTQTVDFKSQPTGAVIKIDGKEYGTAPQSVELKRRGRLKGENTEKLEYNVEVVMDGYYPYEMKIKRSMDGWFLGNLLFGGLLGIIIDAANGSMYQLTPDQMVAQMKEKPLVFNNHKDDKIFIAVTLTPNENWEKIGQLKRRD